MTVLEGTEIEPGGHAGVGEKGFTHRQIQIIYGGVMLGMLLAALDQTIIATALPTIVGDLGGLNHISWVITAYLLASTTSTPIYGKLGDLYGRKIVFQAAIVVFLVASMLAGLSHTLYELIAFRALQGLGGGGILSLAMAIVGDVLSPRERGRYQGYSMSVFAVASISGPAIGGLFTQHLSWRWCFYVNVPIGLIALVVTTTVLDLPFRRVRRTIDWAGSALLLGGVTGILLVTVWAGGEYAWSSPQVESAGLGGVMLLMVFFFHERRAREPVLPLRLFRNSIFRSTSFAGFLVGMSLLGTAVYLPLFLQLVTGTSPTLSGLLILPQMLGVMTAGITVGRRVSKTGRYRIYPIIGSILLPIGLLLMSMMHEGTPRYLSSFYMLIVGAGMGCIMPVLLIAVQNAVAQEDLGIATGANMFFRSMGSSFGVAIFGAIMNARLRFWFPRLIPHGSGTSNSPTAIAYSPSAVHKLALPLRDGIIAAFSHSLDTVFLWAVPLALLLLPTLVFLRQIPLRTGAYIRSAESAFGGELSSHDGDQEVDLVTHEQPIGRTLGAKTT